MLAVDDKRANLLALEVTLGEAYNILFAHSGREAVDLMTRQPGAVDLILMDVQMPEMDGPTAALAIRTREALEGRPRTPIVALTANTMSHHIAEYFAVGMDDFIAKPIEAGRLIEALNRALCAAPDEDCAEVA